MYCDTCIIVDSIRAERDRQADNIRAERHLDGATDAALGQLPEFADEDYLAGYVGKLKELPRDGEGRIVHHSPNQRFAYGFNWSTRNTSKLEGYYSKL